MASIARHQHGEKRAGSVVHAAPTYAENLVPLVPVVDDDAPPTADSGIVEQQIDVPGTERRRDVITKGQDLSLNGDVGDEG